MVNNDYKLLENEIDDSKEIYSCLNNIENSRYTIKKLYNKKKLEILLNKDPRLYKKIIDTTCIENFLLHRSFDCLYKHTLKNRLVYENYLLYLERIGDKNIDEYRNFILDQNLRSHFGPDYNKL